MSKEIGEKDTGLKHWQHVCVTFLMVTLSWTLFAPSMQKEWSNLVGINPENSRDRLTSLMSSSSSYQNVTYEGALVIENGTYIIENMEFHLRGNITVRDNATLITRNAKLVFSRDPTSSEEVLTLKERSKFHAENMTAVFQTSYYSDFVIRVDDQSELNLTGSQLSGWINIFARAEARAFITNSSLTGLGSRYSAAALITRDNTVGRIGNSTVDSVYTQGNSSIQITESKVSMEISTEGNSTVEIDSSQVASLTHLFFDNSTIHVSKSTIGYLGFSGAELNIEDSSIETLSAGCNSVWVRRSSVVRVEANGDSSIWLIDSPPKGIITRDNGKVYIGWQLPILGTLTVPHSWIPALGLILLIAIVIGIIASIIIVRRKWEQRKEKTEPVNQVIS